MTEPAEVYLDCLRYGGRIYFEQRDLVAFLRKLALMGNAGERQTLAMVADTFENYKTTGSRDTL